jgi:hypothetical protein
VTVLEAVVSAAGKRAYSVALERSQACNIESIGNRPGDHQFHIVAAARKLELPDNAPHSVVMLAYVSC